MLIVHVVLFLLHILSYFLVYNRGSFSFDIFISSTCLARMFSQLYSSFLSSCDSTPSVLDVCEFHEGEKKELMTCIKHRLTPQPSKIRAGESHYTIHYVTPCWAQFN